MQTVGYGPPPLPMGVAMTSETEIELRVIPSAPGYLAGSDGMIYSAKPGRFGRRKGLPPIKLKTWMTHDGYALVHVFAPKRRGRTVAPIVAEAFHGPRPDDLVTRHIDGDKTNNRPENLGYCSPAENNADKRKHGTLLFGDRNPMAKISDDQWRELFARGRGGESYVALAKEYGVSYGAVNAVKEGRIRRHLGLFSTKTSSPAIYPADFKPNEVRPIPDFDGYFAEADGTVWSTKLTRYGQSNEPTRLNTNLVGGYLRVCVYGPTGPSSRYVQGLICSAFIGPKPKGMVVAHLNGCPTDNAIENLAYVTQSENLSHRSVHGTRVHRDRRSQTKLTDARVAEIIQRFGAGETQRALAKEFGVTVSTIWRVRKDARQSPVVSAAGSTASVGSTSARLEGH